MATIQYSTLFSNPELEPHHQVQFSVIPKTPSFFLEVLLLCRRYNIYIYIYMKKAEQQFNPNRWIYCDVKPMLNVSVSLTFIRTLISGELFTQQWILVEIAGANKMYTTKKYKRAHSVLDSKVSSTSLARGMIFENVELFPRDEKNPSVFQRNTQR